VFYALLKYLMMITL